MTTHQNLNTKQLLWRSLLPSSTSLILCVGASILLVVANIVLLSVDVGTSLPGILDGQWAIAYTEHVVQPLTSFLANNAFNKSLIALLWGGAGFLVYVGFEYAVHWSRSYKETRGDVQMARGRLVQHPLQNDFWRAIKWRVGILAIGVVFLIAMQPLLRHALSVAPSFVLSRNLLFDSLQAVVAIAEWTLFWHGCVVLLRLYTMRTRIFGDAKLY